MNVTMNVTKKGLTECRSANSKEEWSSECPSECHELRNRTQEGPGKKRRAEWSSECHEREIELKVRPAKKGKDALLSEGHKKQV